MHYTVRWTERSYHERQISEEEMARIKGLTVEELRNLDEDDLGDGLADDLANLDDDGFEGLERTVNEIIRRSAS